MPLPVWPATVPHVSAQPPNALEQPFAPPVVTEVEDGPELMRPQMQTFIERYAYSIKMTHAQYATFRTFAVQTIGQCTSQFIMPVLVLGGSCVDRRVYIEGGQYRAEPRGPSVMVSFRLCVFSTIEQGPVSLVAPSISGGTTIGSVLTCDHGTWSGV